MVIMDPKIYTLRDRSGQSAASVAVTVAQHVAEWAIRRPEIAGIVGSNERLVGVECVEYWDAIAEAVLREDILNTYDFATGDAIRKAAVARLAWHPLFDER